MRFTLLIFCALIGLSGAPVFAADDANTTAASQPVQKSLKDMTREERQAYWAALPEDQKQRILSRRKAVMEKQRSQDQWKARTSVKDEPAPYETLNTQRQQGAKAQWDAMTPEQKKAFLETHQAEIRAGLAARAKAGAADAQ